MPSYSPSSSYLLLSGLVVLFLLARPTKAFGAGNIASISRVEGQNWRHGDIEDTLLGLFMARAAGGNKFSSLYAKRVYFGNWLRDYSQAVDVGTVKSVSSEAIRILLWVLGFMSFGFGTGPFEVTTERLGCYRPEEHIDNPKDYADNVDARRYDPRLRGPVDEQRELSIDPETGLKNYIASERLGITTSAGLIRNVFGRCITLGRQYARSGNKSDLYEALRLLGTGLHCLEDFSAHSNYVELALIELGERAVFPHVGRRTMVDTRGARESVWPLVTGTFGGVDFLHSVMGEFSDKVTQSELDELEGTIQQSQNQGNKSVLQELLSQLPSGLIGGDNQSGKMDELQQNSQAAQMQNMHITPRQPEEWTKQLQDVQKQIYPILEWHDGIMLSITETIEKIPILPTLLETFQEAINIFVFSLLAPFVLPIITQVKAELNTGSSQIIRSSKEKQLIVFHDDYSSDPTHSMLSKDHFSNVLNEPAGKVASQVLKWVVPQIMACWDDERIDVDRTMTRIITGVFHHPALRDYGQDGAVDGRRQMFDIVQQWWKSKNEREQRTLRDQLSREGVQQGRNHKEGVHDSGHGCGKPLGKPNHRTAASSGAIGGSAFGSTHGGQSGRITGEQAAMGVGQIAGEAVGGGALGSIVGGVVGGVGAGLLGEAFQGDDDQKKKYSKQYHGEDGSYTQSYVEVGHHKKKHHDDEERTAQAEFRQTSFPDGGRRQEYQRYEQPGSGSGSGSYGYHQVQETRQSYGEGYERVTETRYERPGGEWESEKRREGRGGDGQYYSETSPPRLGEHDYERRHKKDDSEGDDDDVDSDGHKKKHRKDKDDMNLVVKAVMKAEAMMNPKAEDIPGVGSDMARREEITKARAMVQVGTANAVKKRTMKEANALEMRAEGIIRLQVMSRTLLPAGLARSTEKGATNKEVVMGERVVTAKKVITVDVPAMEKEGEVKDLARNIRDSGKNMPAENPVGSTVDGTSLRRLVDMAVKNTPEETTIMVRAKAMGVKRSRLSTVDKRSMVVVGDTAINRVEMDMEGITELLLASFQSGYTRREQSFLGFG
ncbi:MAG: hypothetical protein M1816_001473 [Peltula sp. TS41687]|nr:MAG: hypothetical protein M1816_001473 [Peltula sp. TS41687]